MCCICHTKPAYNYGFYDDYALEFYCRQCPRNPKRDYFVFGHMPKPITNEIKQEQITIKCQWTEDCKNPCNGWNYKAVPGTMRGQKKRFHCRECEPNEEWRPKKHYTITASGGGPPGGAKI